MAGDIYLGTQSWTNKNWRGNFYPKSTPPENYLAEYAKQFHAVEIDSTFYAIPRAEVVTHWREVTPNDFHFSAKFPRAITHQKILKGAAEGTRQFLDTMTLLKDKLGPLVLQFPFEFRLQHRERLVQFLATLPREFRSRSFRRVGTVEPHNHAARSAGRHRLGVCERRLSGTRANHDSRARGARL